MSVKKSQQFIYFQNKARHYANLKAIRATVNSHNTSFSTQSPRKMAHFVRYDNERTNNKLIDSIALIMNSSHSKLPDRRQKRSQLMLQKQKSSKQIAYQNKILADKMMGAKASIGTLSQWQSRDCNLAKRRHLLNNSRTKLQVYSPDKFLPQHYRIFLEKKADSLEGRKTTLLFNKLFQLPRLRKEESQMKNTTIQ